ncbi:MAG: sugar phosphate isomerase/epimerase family protein [Acidobacteriota bacterium]
MNALKLGIVADEISRNFRDAVRIGIQAGLWRYEVRFLTTGRAPMCDRLELLEVERIRDGEGIEITALSPGLFKQTIDRVAFAHEMAEVFPRALEWAHRWQLQSLIVFGFGKPDATEENADLVSSANPPERVVEGFAEAGAQATTAGLRLLIEPEPICWADSGVATVDLIRRSGSSALGINYDPANVAWALRRDPIDEFDLVAPLIGNVHVKDQLAAPIGSGRPTWVVPGEGMMGYRAHFAALQQIGYNGPISLEPHMDGSLETIRKCKQAVERLWG